MPSSPYNDAELRSFVRDYTADDEPRIRFDWNGNHGEEFVDANIAFREAVKDVVFSDVDAAPIELARDLYKAETECSREAWGIGEGVAVLAERLPRGDPGRFVEDYLWQVSELRRPLCQCFRRR